jgi:hypothetical protein
MASFYEDNLVVFYYLSASEILPDKRCGFWREWPDKRCGLSLGEQFSSILLLSSSEIFTVSDSDVEGLLAPGLLMSKLSKSIRGIFGVLRFSAGNASASEILPDKRCGFCWEWPYKRCGFWWEWPYKRCSFWWEWPYKRCGLSLGEQFSSISLSQCIWNLAC